MRIGLLPLFIELYDKTSKVYRPKLTPFYDEIADMFKAKGINVVKNDFCRIKPEFEQAIEKFEKENVDAVVTLHIAYSPSLESIESLLKTKLPIIVMDTTITPEYSEEYHNGYISFNHGIHGVMDMCSMLKRNKKAYAIAAGHYKNSDVIERVCSFVKSAKAAKALCETKVARVGGSFDGMGDFLISNDEMKERFGVEVNEISPEILAEIKSSVTESEIDEEIRYNASNYDFADDIVENEYREYLTSCITMRKCLENGNYTAFTVNFLEVSGIGAMPFLEACKAMERGIGYAGEGDSLTAAFTGAFMDAYKETCFVEIFCPDWKNDMLLLSHMGEINYGIIKNRPVIHRTKGNSTNGSQPYRGFAAMKGGEGVYVNISRDADNFQLLIAEAEIVEREPDLFKTAMRGWMKPVGYTTAEFLENHSKYGATHHSIFIYGAKKEEIEYFGKLLDMDVVVM